MGETACCSGGDAAGADCATEVADSGGVDGGAGGDDGVAACADNGVAARPLPLLLAVQSAAGAAAVAAIAAVSPDTACEYVCTRARACVCECGCACASGGRDAGFCIPAICIIPDICVLAPPPPPCIAGAGGCTLGVWHGRLGVWHGALPVSLAPSLPRSLPLPLSCTPSSTSGECTGGSTVESTVVGGGVGKNGVGALALGKYGVSARNDTLAALPLELALVHAATGSGD